MGTNAAEYSCSQKREGKWKLYRFLLALLYVSYTVAYFYIIIETRFFPLGALIPVTLWIIVYFTWRYTSPDYKYTIDAGILTFYVSYGKKTHEKFKLHIKEALAIVPHDQLREHIDGVKIKKAYNALPSKSESDAYSIVFEKETKVYIFNFKVTRDTLKALHYYNNTTVI